MNIKDMLNLDKLNISKKNKDIYPFYDEDNIIKEKESKGLKSAGISGEAALRIVNFSMMIITIIFTMIFLYIIYAYSSLALDYQELSKEANISESYQELKDSFSNTESE